VKAVLQWELSLQATWVATWEQNFQLMIPVATWEQNFQLMTLEQNFQLKSQVVRSVKA
jgi:hypothetical protein